MVFSSVIFLLYFLPLFFIFYYSIPARFRNFFILLSSIFFYSWGAPKFIFVIIGTTVLDFFLVRKMYYASKKWQQKLFLVLSLSMNLGLLFYFKYCNFFVQNINEMLYSFGFVELEWTQLLLPIGISFYTFETVTYVVDVYRRVHAPLKNFWDYQLYIILFPKLIAGPIIRFHEIADQITDRSKNDTIQFKLNGFIRFVLGLSKKVLIANVMGAYADNLLNGSLNDLSTLSAWLGILAYTFQIYFDFSGYSDMALGLGMMMGFVFPENFNNPYTAQSITDFWRRWHITLGAWMRNYLYIPLGGNKVSKRRLYLNLWLVFLASGFWHGASWNFIIWGAYHGLFLILERGFLLEWYKKIHPLIKTVLTFIIVMIGWVFFRLEHFDDAIFFIEKLFSFKGTQVNLTLLSPETISIFVIGTLFAFFTSFNKGLQIQEWLYSKTHTFRAHLVLSLVAICLFTLSIASITGTGFNPFIYFRF
ncbi:MAG: MBOAT family protein [Bacteroidetes bacterium]|nr:MBOAT family protein [Bacteroidota bacterium]